MVGLELHQPLQLDGVGLNLHQPIQWLLLLNVYLVRMYKKGNLPPNDYQIQTISTTYNMSQTTINHLSFEEDIDTCGSLGPFRVNHPNQVTLKSDPNEARETLFLQSNQVLAIQAKKLYNKILIST